MKLLNVYYHQRSDLSTVEGAKISNVDKSYRVSLGDLDTLVNNAGTFLDTRF